MGEALVYVVVALVVAVAMAEIALPGLNAALQRRMAFDYLGDPALPATMVAVAVGRRAAGRRLSGAGALGLPSRLGAEGRAVRAVPAAGGLRQALVVTQFCVLIVAPAGGHHHRAPDRLRHQRGHARQPERRGGAVRLPLHRHAARCGEGRAGRRKRGLLISRCAGALPTVSINVTANGRRRNLTIAPVDFGFFELYGRAAARGAGLRRGPPGRRRREPYRRCAADRRQPVGGARARLFVAAGRRGSGWSNWHYRPAASIANFDASVRRPTARRRSSASSRTSPSAPSATVDRAVVLLRRPRRSTC